MYLTDTFGINRMTFLTVSARYNYAQTQTRDNTGLEPDLNGDNTFSRVTPAIGLNWNPSRAFNTFIGYNEGMRVPTPAELTCADPSAPCKLPNAFLADPPLEPVLAKTFELGTRGAITSALSYTASLYRTNLSNDIQFVSASSTGATGYFQNVGTTRRQGLELGMQNVLAQADGTGCVQLHRRDLPDPIHGLEPKQLERECSRRYPGPTRRLHPRHPQEQLQAAASTTRSPRG